MNIPVSSSEAITEESLVQDFAILWTQLSQPIQDSIKESTLWLKSLTAIHIRINALCRDTVVQSTNLLFIQWCNTITRWSRELEAKIFEKVKSIMESSKSSTLLQSIGDHIVWRDGNYVKKSPYRSRLTVEEVEQSIDFFDLNFGEFSPKTQVFDILGSYCIVQPYINWYQLGDYLQKKWTDLNPNIKHRKFC